MIILIGASSGLGVKILPKLLNIDSVLALYKNNKINYFRSKKKLFIEKIDITSESDIKRIIKKHKKNLTKVTCLNLAAITLDKLAVNIKKNELNYIFDVNCFSNIIFSKHLIPIMIKEKYGRFIHFSSSKAVKGDIGITGYAASKSALEGISNCLAKEYASFGITSNIISLGYFNTELWKRLKPNKQNELMKEIPSKTLGTEVNIFNTIKNIILSDYLNGANIKLDGGL